MGRKQIYKTKTQQLNARKARQMRYYWRNANKLKIQALLRYYNRKTRNEKIV